MRYAREPTLALVSCHVAREGRARSQTATWRAEEGGGDESRGAANLSIASIARGTGDVNCTAHG